MMKAESVVEAARLLDQLAKLKKFLDESPDDPETVTFTLRKGKDSKSLTLRPYPLPNFDLVEIVERLEMDTAEELKKMGVEIDDRT